MALFLFTPLYGHYDRGRKMDAHFLILRNVHPEKQKNVCQFLEFEKRASQKAKNGCQLLNYEKLTSTLPLKGSGDISLVLIFSGF